MHTMKDYYQVLGLLDNADSVVIKAAYKALAQKYHPDKNKELAEKNTFIMMELNEAYGVLGYASKRKAYDAKLVKQRGAKSSQAHNKPKENKTNTNADLLKKINDNEMDEVHLVQLFEKLFNKPLKISHGWMNSYSYKDSEKNISMSYNQLREKLVQQLTSI